MKLGVAGKGGAGKTVLVGLLARAFAEQGRNVLAVDLDVNPGLAVSLGLAPDDTPLPEEAVEERTGAAYGWTLSRRLTPAEAVRRYGIPAGPRVMYLGFGNIASAIHPLRQYITAVRHVAEHFDEPDWVVITDLGAGPTPVFEGQVRGVSLALVVAEPTVASALGAERILSMLHHDRTPAELVENKAVSADNGPRSGSAVFARIPFDPHLRQLEGDASLTDVSSSSPALEAARELAAMIELRSEL